MKLIRVRGVVQHNHYLIHTKGWLMSLIPTANQSDIVSPVDVLAMCVSTSQGGPAPTLMPSPPCS